MIDTVAKIFGTVKMPCMWALEQKFVKSYQMCLVVLVNILDLDVNESLSPNYSPSQGHYVEHFAFM